MPNEDSDSPLRDLLAASAQTDMTGTSFRPHNLGEWGTHTDVSIDHAIWFHRAFRADEWIFVDLHTLINECGRSAIRGQYYDRAGQLCMSMAQELLIRPLNPQSSVTGDE